MGRGGPDGRRLPRHARPGNDPRRLRRRDHDHRGAARSVGAAQGALPPHLRIRADRRVAERGAVRARRARARLRPRARAPRIPDRLRRAPHAGNGGTAGGARSPHLPRDARRQLAAAHDDRPGAPARRAVRTRRVRAPHRAPEPGEHPARRRGLGNPGQERHRTHQGRAVPGARGVAPVEDDGLRGDDPPRAAARSRDRALSLPPVRQGDHLGADRRDRVGRRLPVARDALGMHGAQPEVRRDPPVGVDARRPVDAHQRVPGPRGRPRADRPRRRDHHRRLLRAGREGPDDRGPEHAPGPARTRSRAERDLLRDPGRGARALRRRSPRPHAVRRAPVERGAGRAHRDDAGDRSHGSDRAHGRERGARSRRAHHLPGDQPPRAPRDVRQRHERQRLPLLAEQLEARRIRDARPRRQPRGVPDERGQQPRRPGAAEPRVRADRRDERQRAPTRADRHEPVGLQELRRRGARRQAPRRPPRRHDGGRRSPVRAPPDRRRRADRRCLREGTRSRRRCVRRMDRRRRGRGNPVASRLRRSRALGHRTRAGDEGARGGGAP